MQLISLCLQGTNLLRLQTFRPLPDREFDPLSVLQGATTIGHDLCVMHKHIITAGFTLDKAEAFLIVKPLNGPHFAI